MGAAVDAAQQGLRRLAPACDGDNIKSRIGKAARAAELSYWRAFDLWYGKARRIDADELVRIRDAQCKCAKEPENDLAAIASDFEALAERLAKVAARTDRVTADHLRLLASRARRLVEGA